MQEVEQRRERLPRAGVRANSANNGPILNRLSRWTQVLGGIIANVPSKVLYLPLFYLLPAQRMLAPLAK